MYLRVIHEMLQDSRDAEQRLRACISSAPGVTRVIKIEAHVRGGYAVLVDVDGELDELISHIETGGWRGVL
jgi:divalent metal cation (Fe/Co/Zn/Cd) transporter